MKKRFVFLVAIFAAAVGFGLVSCSSDSSSGDDGGPEQTKDGNGTVTGSNPVRSVTTAANSSSVVLAWLLPSDTSNYGGVKITWNDGYKSIYSASTTTYTISGLEANTSYTFTITTLDKSWNETSSSVSISITTVAASSKASDTIAPASVTNLTAVAGVGKVLLTWTNSIDTDFFGAKISISPKVENIANPFVVVGNYSSNSSTLIEGLAGGTEYTFSVSSLDKSLNESSKTTATTTVLKEATDSTAPAEVTNLTAANLDGAVQLSWEDPADSDLFGIEITYEENSASSSRAAISAMEAGSIFVAPGTQACEISNLANGTPYTFTAKAMDTSGNKSGSESVEFTPAAIEGNVMKITLTPSTTQPTDENVTVSVGITTDADGIKTVKYASGEESTSYFTTAGTKITADSNGAYSFEASENGTYTAFVQDSDGRRECETIEIINVHPIYKISYELNGGTNSTENPDTYKYKAGTISLKEPTKAGYKFEGWFTEQTFENQKTEITTGSIGDIELFAKWQIITYSISYELNGGTNAAENPSTYNCKTDTIDLKEPTKTGYKFEGWFTEQSFEDQKEEIATGSIGNVELFAKWQIITYSISYELNGGSNASENPASYTVESAGITFEDAETTKFGCIFAGWFTDSAFENQKTGIQSGSVGNITLYAKWIFSAEKLKSQLASSATGKTISVAIDTEITKEDISSIAEIIKEGSNSVELDLRNATGSTEIADEVFNSCTNLVSIVLPNTVTTLKECVFYKCTSLKKIIIPASVTKIGNSSFYGCTELSDVVFEDSPETISLGYNKSGEGMFYDCQLKNLYVGRNISYETSSEHGYSPFANNKTEGFSVIYGGKATKIDEYEFYNCTGLKALTIPSTVTTIEYRAFWNCSKLSSIVIPSSVTKIASYAFSGCSKLTSVDFKSISKWYVSSYSDYSDYKRYGGTLISSVELIDEATAAKYLTSTYYSYNWYKE